MSAHPLDVVLQRLAIIAPLRLAESWDNVGLLVGDRRRLVSRVMTCLTVTPEVVAEARDCGVNLLITHHPLPFKPLSKITSDTYSGKMLLDLIAGDIAVYSAHTAFDSAAEGINAMWADWLGLKHIQPLEPRTTETDLDVGSGRYGRLPAPIALARLAHEIADYVGASHFRLVESTPDPPVLKVAIALRQRWQFCTAGQASWLPSTHHRRSNLSPMPGGSRQWRQSGAARTLLQRTICHGTAGRAIGGRNERSFRLCQ